MASVLNTESDFVSVLDGDFGRGSPSTPHTQTSTFTTFTDGGRKTGNGTLDDGKNKRLTGLNWPYHKPKTDSISRSYVTQARITDQGINLFRSTTSTKEADEEINLLLPHITVSLNTLLAVLSLLLNLFIITFYWSHSSNFSSILYLRNAVADSISAAGFLLQVPLVIRVLHEDIPPSLPLISYCITTVSVRMSVFMNCVLGVVRCINILNPFYLINRKYVAVSTLIYFLVWSTISSVDIWTYMAKVGLQNQIYLIKSLVLKPEPGFSLSFILTSLSQGELVMLQFFIPLVLPAVLCFVLMTIQIHHLTRQSDIPKHSGAGKILASPDQVVTNEKEKKKKPPNRNQKAAVTILIVTTIYVLTSTLSVLMWLVVYRTHMERRERIKKVSWTELGLIYMSSSTFHLLSSTFTALTLLLRSSQMKLYLRDSFRNTISSRIE